jgi:hypothetical protein
MMVLQLIEVINPKHERKCMGKLVKRLSLGALLLVFVLATSAFGQTEILVNGDFESWDNLTTPTSWSKVENIDKDSTEVHGGTYSAKHTGGTKDLGQYVTVTPGYTYDITIWYKVTAGDGDDARIWCVWKSAGTSVYDNTDGIRGPNGGYFDNNGGVWSTFDTTVVAPETVDTLYFELRAYSGATVYWDDLSVVETAPPAEDPDDYFIPKGAHGQGYVSLKAAVDSINANGVVGEINFVLDADTLREESFTFAADLDEDNNVTVKPAPGRDVVLIVVPGDSKGNGAQMIGFDKGYVTFDGSNDGSDSRNLIVTTETNDTRVPFGLNTADADDIVVKNLIIKNLDNVADDFKYGMVSNDVGGNNFTIDNCQIGSVDAPIWRDGVAVWGDWTYGAADAIVTNNEIHAGARGISTYIGGYCKFNNNTVYLHPAATTYSYAYGIYISYVKTSEVMNNEIYGLEKTTTAAKMIGIATASNPAGAVFTVANNMVVVGAADETKSVYGFGMVSNSNQRNFNLYHNTFVINDNSGTEASHGIGHYGATGPVDIDLKNNIIINKNTGNAASSAIHLPLGTDVLASNGNDLVSAGNFVTYRDSLYADVAAWAGAGHGNAVSTDVTFESATDLHLAIPSDTDLDLVMPAVGVDMDIDGDARGTFFAYAGADEGSAYPASNDLNIGFADDSDLTNWVKDAWENVSHNATREALQFADGGWGAGLKRAVSATPGSVYKLTLFVETSGWDAGNMDVSVEGLGNDLVKTSVISEGSQTEISLIGIADGETGNIYLTGSYPGTHPDTVWVDSVSWDDQYMDVIPSYDIASLTSNVSIGDDCAGICVLTAVTIGAPAFGQDATAGIALYEWDIINDPAVEEGDEILFVGERAEYNGLQQVKNIDDYVVLSKGNVVEPTLITVPDLADYHCMLVMIEDVDTVAGFTWPTWSSSQTLTDGTNEFIMRIDSDGEMVDSLPPESWPLDLIGVVGWYNAPQMMPRYMADFLTNQAPADFLILNPADSAVIASFEDSNIKEIEMDGDTIYAMFVNWEAAYDKEGDSLTYEMIFIGDGPEEEMITADTFMYIPLEQETPYEMNGTYTYYFTATDPMNEMAYSDTHAVTFDFPAPPEIQCADVVLLEGVPTMYVEFNLPIMASPANFKFVDWTDGGSVTDPTGMNFLNANTIMLSGTFVEDHQVSLISSGVMTPGSMVTVEDTSTAMHVYIPFSAAHPEDDALMIEDFEETIGAFKGLTYSGSTNGILTTSTFDVSDEVAYEGSKSGKINILDDPAVADGWFIRIPYDYASYAYNYMVKANSTIMLLLKGTATNVDIALTIKDTGYERMMWKSVSLCGTDWQVVSFDLANDEATGWITGNGIITPNDDGMVSIGDIHISCDADEDATIYIDGFTERQVLSPVDITLSVMMHEWLRLGKFNLASDYVDAAGTFNGWDGSGTILGDLDSDTTYSVVVPMMPYSTQNFKFRINGSWSDATAEFPYGGPARELVVPSIASEFTYWYNNDTLEVAIDGIPVEFALHQNYPNPFNPVTTINFDLPNITDVSLVIYDITGRKVRTLVSNSNIDAGYKKIVWNGRDDFGNGVATGMYIYRLVAGDFVDVKKMTFLK